MVLQLPIITASSQKANKCSHLTQIATSFFGGRVAPNIPKKYVTICAGATGVMVQNSMAMKITYFIVLIFYFNVANAIEVSDVESSISNKGAAATLGELSWPYEKWNAFIKEVESGDARWVALAIKLRSASDAGASFELDHSLAHAYSKNPKAFSDHLNPNQLCNPNYMELSTKPEAEAYLNRMKTIISELPESAFKSECNKLVIRYEQWVSEWDGTPP